MKAGRLGGLSISAVPIIRSVVTDSSETNAAVIFSKSWPDPRRGQKNNSSVQIPQGGSQSQLVQMFDNTCRNQNARMALAPSPSQKSGRRVVEKNAHPASLLQAGDGGGSRVISGFTQRRLTSNKARACLKADDKSNDTTRTTIPRPLKPRFNLVTACPELVPPSPERCTHLC